MCQGRSGAAWVKKILKRIDAAIAATTHEVRAYMKYHPGFDDIGNRTLQQWEEGVALSLRAV